MPLAYISIGSNIEPRLEYLRQAVLGLKKPPLKLLQVSSVYQTEPVGNKEQAPFLNAIAAVQTILTAADLLVRLKELEGEAKKKVEVPKGPRTLDLDLVLFGGEVRNTPDLQVPHPRMTARGFVLVPLCEINPGIRHPVGGQTVAELLFLLPKQSPKVEWWGDLGVAAD